MRRLVLLFVFIFLLNACQTTSYEGKEDSPYYRVPVGSGLTLHQDIEIPPHRVGVYLQDGQIKPLSQINRYYPHCKFEVMKIRDIPQTVHADTFMIEKVAQEITIWWMPAGYGLPAFLSASASICTVAMARASRRSRRD